MIAERGRVRERRFCQDFRKVLCSTRERKLLSPLAFSQKPNRGYASR
jgi:hypothetical protein